MSTLRLACVLYDATTLVLHCARDPFYWLSTLICIVAYTLVYGWAGGVWVLLAVLVVLPLLLMALLHYIVSPENPPEALLRRKGKDA